MHANLALAVATCLVLAGCAQAGHDQAAQGRAATDHAASTHATTAAPNGSPLPLDTNRFDGTRMGFYIDYPADMVSSTHFDDGYQFTRNWKAYASDPSTGTPLLMLTLPGSNKVSTAELRIGASNQAGQVRECDQPPAAVRPGTQDTTDINGIHFVSWQAGDAAMSHYLNVHGYRVVHDGYCFAIDLLLARTNPHVYDPPKTPPFTKKAAFAKLHKALAGFHFTR